jgi:hypothetical protein
MVHSQLLLMYVDNVHSRIPFSICLFLEDIASRLCLMPLMYESREYECSPFWCKLEKSAVDKSWVGVEAWKAHSKQKYMFFPWLLVPQPIVISDRF